MTPGILPSSPGTDAAKVWNNQWVACETAQIKGKTQFVIHQEVVQFTMGSGSTANGTYIAPTVQRTSSNTPLQSNSPWYPKPHPALN